MNRIHACIFICLLLLGCLSCADPPPSVMELVMPDNGETTEPPDMTTATEEGEKEGEEGAATAAEEPNPGTEKVTDIESPTEIAVIDAIPPPSRVNTSLLAKMEAILSVDGEVLSPIPDDVYDLLWGHFTKAGSAAPRQFYTKYIDADRRTAARAYRLTTSVSRTGEI